MRSFKISERIDFSQIFDELRKRNAKKVGIQLPDGLKFFTREIVERFEKEGHDVIVSGSASYGACDIDLSLLKEADILVHFAHLPIKSYENIIFAPYYYEYSIGSISRWIGDIEEDEVSLAGTPQYAWKFTEVKEYLEGHGIKVRLEKAIGRVKVPGQVLGCNYSSIKNSAESILFIGDGEFHARGAAIYTGKKVYFFNPLANEFRIFGKEVVEDFLKSRYLKISKAMQLMKEGVGLIVSSKVGQKRLALARRLKVEGEKKGVSSTILYFDEISPMGLANFPYGIYVNTACPRLTYDESEKFEKPLLSPQEFEILLGIRKWEEYRLDEIG